MTTYEDRERSVADSEPLELYKFTRTTGAVVEAWLYANCESDVVFNSETYTGTAGLHRGDIQQNGEDTTMQVDVDIPRICCVTDELRGTLSPSPIHMTIYRWQRGLADGESATLFNGEIASALFEGSFCKIVGTSEEAAWSDSTGRVFCQRTCPHMLFDAFCGADASRVTFSGTITDISVDLLTITVVENDSPDDHVGSGSTFYNAGVVNFLGRKVFVVQQVDDVLTLQTPLLGAVVGDSVQLIAGCNRHTTDCLDVHDNIERFGGFALMPDRSPWQTLN
jgi:hypothetical protein